MPDGALGGFLHIMSDPVSLKVIARHLDLSVGTVSMALRDDTRVSGATRARVKAAAKALGYRPDPEISRLITRLQDRKRRSYRSTLCAFGPWKRQALNATQREILDGFEARITFLGYRVDYRILPADREAGEWLAKELRARGVEACILLPMAREKREVGSVFDWERFGAVSFMPALANRLDFVGMDWGCSLELVMRGAHASGAKRIGVILGRVFDACLPAVQATVAADLASLGRGSRFVPHFEVVQPMTGTPTEPFPVPGLRDWFVRERPDLLVVTWEPWVRSVQAELDWPPICPIPLLVVGRAVVSRYAGTIHDYRLVGRVGADVLDRKMRMGWNPVSLVPPIRNLLTPCFAEPCLNRGPQPGAFSASP
jgi:hypothetical protein